MKLSVTTKLDGIKSWSLQALETCPGSIGVDGELVDACKGCYATTGNYRFANVKAPASLTVRIGSVTHGCLTWCRLSTMIVSSAGLTVGICTTCD